LEHTVEVINNVIYHFFDWDHYVRLWLYWYNGHWLIIVTWQGHAVTRTL